MAPRILLVLARQFKAVVVDVSCVDVATPRSYPAPIVQLHPRCTRVRDPCAKCAARMSKLVIDLINIYSPETLLANRNPDAIRSTVLQKIKVRLILARRTVNRQTEI